MKDPTNRPAHVQSVDERTKLINEAKAYHSSLRMNERKSLESAIALGEKLLKIKAKTVHGQWLPTLEQIGVDRKRAAEYMRLAKCPAQDICSANSIREAMQHVAAESDEGEEPPEREPGCDEPQEQEETQPPAETIFCRPCRVSGKPKPGCKDCIIARQQHAAGNESSNGGGRGTSTGVKAGAPTFSLKTFAEHLAKGIAEISKLAHAAGLEHEGKNGQAASVIETAEMKAIRAKLEEARAMAEAWLKKLEK